jgi:hypothetical protein
VNVLNITINTREHFWDHKGCRLMDTGVHGQHAVGDNEEEYNEHLSVLDDTRRISV